MKNILVINSLRKFDPSLFDLFRDLNQSGFLFGWLGEKNFLEKFKEIGSAKKIFFGPKIEKPFDFFIFLFFAPLLWAGYFLKLYFFSRKEKIEKIICIGFREKIIFTPVAKFLKLAVIWLELPGDREFHRKAFLTFLRLFSAPVEIVVFTAPAAAALAENRFKQEKINNISLGINLRDIDRQGNIFYNLAKADKPYSFYKNFTVGAVVGRNDRRRLELLLQAAKSCLNFIPNFRLVVIGATAENSNLNWLVKKMGIENKVWLVGEQKNPLQWFDDFDLYVALQESPGLSDLETVLLAASRGVPPIVFKERNTLDIINDGRTGFWVERDSAEALGQKIIEIEADQRFCREVGENAKKMVYSNFDRKKQIKRLAEIINKNV